MIKVCMVVHNEIEGDQRVRRYCESLVAMGAQVDVLCLRGSSGAAGGPAGTRLYCQPRLRLSPRPWNYLMEYGATLLLFSLRLLWLFARNRYHVVHVHNMPDFLIFTALLPRLFGARLVLDIHDPMPEFYLSKYSAGRGNSLPTRLLRMQERLSCRMADLIITANANFRDNLARRGVPPDKMTVITNVPNPRVFRRPAPVAPTEKPRFSLLYPGTIAPRYGLETAIRAVPELARRIPHLRLLILGKEADALRPLVAELGVERWVELCPCVPQEQLVRHMAEADIGIYPALSSPHMDIATPTKVLEYAAMGLPIVASRLRILEQLFGPAALCYCTPGSVQEFTGCVLQLYENPALRQELVRRVDEVFVRAHPPQQEQDKYFAVINRLLAPRGLDLYAGKARPAAPPPLPEAVSASTHTRAA